MSEYGFDNPFGQQDTDFEGAMNGARALAGQIKGKRDEVAGLLLGLGLPATVTLGKSLLGTEAYDVATKQIFQKVFGNDTTVQQGEASNNSETIGEALGNSEPADPISLSQEGGGASELSDMSGQQFSTAPADSFGAESGEGYFEQTTMNPAFEGDTTATEPEAMASEDLPLAETSFGSTGAETVTTTAGETTGETLGSSLADLSVDTVTDTVTDAVTGGVTSALETAGLALDSTGIGAIAGVGLAIVGGLAELGVALKDLIEPEKLQEIATATFSPGV